MKLNVAKTSVNVYLEHKSFGSITLSIRIPTFAETINESDDLLQRVTDRLSHVVGWDGVEDADGAPLPFTKEAFFVALGQFPVLRYMTYDKILELYMGSPTGSAEGTGGSDSGNLPAPPAITSPAAAA